MKKYLIALLFGMSLMAMQTASAATVTLNGSSILYGTGPGTYSLSVTGAAADDVLGFATFGSSAYSSLSGPMLFSLTNTGATALLDGLTQFKVTGNAFALAIGKLVGGDFIPQAAAVGDVPVPAAIWLFGSALMGLVGASRRKA